MKDMLLVSEVAGLAKQIEKRMSEVSDLHSAMVRWNEGQLRGLSYDDDDALSLPRSSRSIGTKKVVVDPDSRDPLTGSLDESDRFVISQMLEEWEEPDAERPEDGYVPISAVLNFRKALVFIQKRYPFSYAFGEASTREECIESSQNVYFRLLERTPESDVLHFETLALITVDEDSAKIDQDKARELMKLFRPDRQGNLTLIDFVRSVDSVYKAYRLLSASIANSSRIDQAFERIFNVVFYVVAAIVVLAALGFDPVAIFLSLSSIVLAFAFM